MSIINGLWRTASVGSKLLGAAGALFIATVMLVMSTMAWFTISKAPQASNINVSVTNAQNFEIAKAQNGSTTKPEEVTNDDSANQYAWGSNISFGDSSNPIQIELPASVDGGLVKTVTFNETTGRTAGLETVTQKSEASEGVEYYLYNGKKCAAVMGMWLRTNTTGDIKALMTGLTVTGGNDGFNTNSVKVAVKLGEGGNYVPLTVDVQSDSMGSLEASREGTYVELMVYLNGDNTGGDGVVAYDVGGTTPITVNISNIKFTNSNVAENTQ